MSLFARSKPKNFWLFSVTLLLSYNISPTCHKLTLSMDQGWCKRWGTLFPAFRPLASLFYESLCKEQTQELLLSFCYSKKSVWQGFSNDLFSFKLFQVIYKSYRQVLTSSQISRLLLKPRCLDKFRLAYNLNRHIHDYTRYN